MLPILSALLRRFHDAVREDAAEVVVWGSGAPLREFLHVDDLADALLLMRGYSSKEMINVGSGQEISIADLARTLAGITGFEGRVSFDASRTDGTPRKVLDSSRLAALGWRPGIALQEGLSQTYTWFDAQRSSHGRA